MTMICLTAIYYAQAFPYIDPPCYECMWKEDCLWRKPILYHPVEPEDTATTETKK